MLDADAIEMTITLNYEPGESLDGYVDLNMSSTLSRSACTSILRQMSSALAYLQAKSIVHDDVKPENMIWSNEHNRAVLVDFGAAFDLMTPQEHFEPSGTPSYVPPEFLNKRKSDKGDIWALGIVMLFALGTITLPNGAWFLPSVFHEGDDQRQMKDWLEAIARFTREVAETQPLVVQMLEADPDERISSVALRESVSYDLCKC